MIIKTEKVTKKGVEMTQELHHVNNKKFTTCYNENYSIFEVEYEGAMLADWDYSDSLSRANYRQEHINLSYGDKPEEELGDEFDEEADRKFGIDQYPGGEGFDQDCYDGVVETLTDDLEKDHETSQQCLTSWT